MFRLTVWNKHYVEIGTIERPSATELLDLGKRLQEDYGAVYKVEWVDIGERMC
jgi:hypothetical protein